MARTMARNGHPPERTTVALGSVCALAGRLGDGLLGAADDNRGAAAAVTSGPRCPTSIPLRRGGHASAFVASCRPAVAQGYRLPARSSILRTMTRIVTTHYRYKRPRKRTGEPST
jgi:hypothetical protein